MKIRRLFAFLFRHDFDVDPSRVRFEGNVLWTTLVCKRCRHEARYPTTQFEAFRAIYRMRGCPGSKEPT